MKLERVEDIHIPFVKGIFYGKAGAGKTTLSASAALDPRLAPALMLSCVGNPVAIRRMRPAPYLFNVNEISDIKDTYDWLANGQSKKDTIFTVYKEKFGIELPTIKTVIIDQLTGLQGLFMRKHLGNTGKWTGQKKAEFDDWAALLQFMEAISYNFFELLPMNVLMTALERVEVDNLTQVQSWGIGLMGQSQMVVPSYSPLLVRLVRQAQINSAAAKQLKLSEETYTVAFFDVLGRYEAKDQYGIGVRHMESPTMTKIMDLIVASDDRTVVEDTKSVPTESKGA